MRPQSSKSKAAMRPSCSWMKYIRMWHGALRANRKRHLLTIAFVASIILVPFYYKSVSRDILNWKDAVKDTQSVMSLFQYIGQSRNSTETKIDKVDFGEDICQNLQKPEAAEILIRNRYWQVHQEGKEDIVVYSAFFDDRPIVGVNPWIRVLGVRRLSDRPLWCYVWYSANRSPFVVEAEIIQSGANQAMRGGNTYSQNLFSCQLNVSKIIPTHVSLANRLCAKSTIYLPIVSSELKSTWTHNFGVCLEVNFGYFPPELIVEWMELHSMLGVTVVNLYNGSVDSRLDPVFNYYIKNGFLDFRQMPPVFGDNSSNGVRLASPASLNDCMLRNMYTHRFIVVIDFDEVIVPRMHTNYLDLVQHIDRSLNLSQSYHTYSFRNAYFFTYFPEDLSQPEFLKTVRLRHRAQPSGYLFGAKSFLDPRQCKSVFNHYCWVRFNDTGRLSIDVDVSLGLSHHYRSKCPFDKDHCDSYDKEKTVDDIMLKFKTVLAERVSKVLKEIGIV